MARELWCPKKSLKADMKVPIPLPLDVRLPASDSSSFLCPFSLQAGEFHNAQCLGGVYLWFRLTSKPERSPECHRLPLFGHFPLNIVGDCILLPLSITHPLSPISAFPGDRCSGDMEHSLYLGSSVPELSPLYLNSAQCDCLVLSGLVPLSVKGVCRQKHCSVHCRYGISDETLP